MAPYTKPNKKTDTKISKEATTPKKDKVATETESVDQVAQQEDVQDKYLRLCAEFENYKRRTDKERLNWITNANQGIIMTLLPMLEDFERALSIFNTTEPEHKEQHKGIQLIYDKFFKVLQQQGLSPIQIAKGDTFNPDQHEALTQVPTEDKALKGKIIEVIAKGYLLHDKTIRIAKVIIGT